jgi:hypothetical protein
VVKVRKEKLRPGMVLAEDVVGKGGVNLRAGMSLTPRYLGLLTNPTLFPQQDVNVTPDSYNSIIMKFSDELKREGEVASLEISDELFSRHGISRTGETDFLVEGDLAGCSEQLNIPGNLTVTGSIDRCVSLFISGCLAVRKDLRDTSATVKKDVTVGGEVLNSSPMFKISAFGMFSAGGIQNAQVNAGDVTITHSIVGSQVIADNSIDGPSAQKIQDSKLQAGYNILLGRVKEGTTLVIFSEKQLNTVRKMLEVEKRLVEFDREIEPLRQSIRVYQILKDRLNELPVDKREKLLNNLRLVKTKLEKKKFLHQQFSTLKFETERIRKSREDGPITVEEEIVKGTRIVIDNQSFVVQIQDKGVVFYKKSFIIMGKKDKEWGRLT